MASKRFLIVPDDSSAASMPLPGVTMASATLLRSARFIGASSNALLLASQTRRFSGNSQQNCRENYQENSQENLRGRGGEACLFGSGCLSCDFRIKLALAVALRHLGRRQHLLDLAGLTRGVEFLQPLFAQF